MKSLTFAFPEMHPGLNTTIRKGTLKLYDFPPGTEFEMCDADYGAVNGRAKVVEVVAKHFSALTEAEIRAHHLVEHLPPQGRREGLLHIMQYHYPDFREDDVVTVITFEVSPFPLDDDPSRHDDGLLAALIADDIRRCAQIRPRLAHNLDLLRCPFCGSLHIRRRPPSGPPTLGMYCFNCGETWHPISLRQGFESPYRFPELHDPCYRRENDFWRNWYLHR